MAVTFVMAIAFVAEANAANYKMLLCAGGNGSNSFDTATNTISASNPNGIFDFENHCGPAPDPAGNNAFLRIAENQSGGNAGVNAYGSISWTPTPWVAIVAAGGYTREPGSFNDGWRGRFWVEGWDGSVNNILMQGSSASNSGISWFPTSTFSPHLWPFGGYGDYRRFIFELTCVRPGGCDRSSWNAVDANTMVLVLSDREDARVQLTDGSALMRGEWSHGSQLVTWNSSDQGSGLRWERLRVDGSERQVIDNHGSCDIGVSGPTGEFARQFRPCSGGPYSRSYALDTTTVADGARTVEVCAQDYAQSVGLDGTGSQSCNRRTIRVDNTAPGAPVGLAVSSANPQRYMNRFGATFTLPPNQGSPIAKAHYSVLDAAGKVLVPEKTLSGTDLTAIAGIEGPEEPGAYRLAVRLEDAVGLIGPTALAPIPHDTTPPAAPQDLSVTAPQTARSVDGFDVRWRNILDGGSPIDAVHYRILGEGGEVILTKTIAAGNPQSIRNLETAAGRGSYTLELWLSDAEQNVGAPAKVPLAYDCVRSEVGEASSHTAGLGGEESPSLLVSQGEGSTLRGKLRGLDRSVSAPVCVFGRVVTESERQFLGVAMAEGGDYEFAIGAGPSRELTALYRPDQRELSTHALLRTRVRPSFELQSKVVRNKGFAIFKGAIPGPHGGKVVVVLQVKSGKGWRVFRRYRTREDGSYLMRYRFTKTTTPTVYIMRAQVRAQIGLPYEEGNSEARRLRVVP